MEFDLSSLASNLWRQVHKGGTKGKWKEVRDRRRVQKRGRRAEARRTWQTKTQRDSSASHLIPHWREVPRFKTFTLNHGHKGCKPETPRSSPGIPRQIHQVWARESEMNLPVVKQSCALCGEKKKEEIHHWKLRLEPACLLNTITVMWESGGDGGGHE